MLINKAYKFRLYPDKEMVEKLYQQTGNSRFLWNKLLEFNKNHIKTDGLPTQAVLQSQIVEIKGRHDFLKETHSQPLQINAKRMVEANSRSVKKEVIGKRLAKVSKAELTKIPKKLAEALDFGRPKFKRRSDDRSSLFYPQNIKLRKTRVYFPKLGWIKVIRHRKIEGKILNSTITRDGDNWYVSFCCEQNIEVQQKDLSKVIGVDVGIKNFAVFSDETKIINPMVMKKNLKKLGRAQRKLSKKTFVEKEIGNKTIKVASNNRGKQKKKVQTIHRRISRQRKDFLHKLTSYMIAKYTGIVVETLSIQEMLAKNGSNQNRNTLDVSWYQFIYMLEYKCKESGVNFHKLNKWFASTQTCSCCGSKQKMDLDQRIYNCSNCKLEICRDLNGAKSIQIEGLKCFFSTAGTAGFQACGEVTIVSSTKQEQKTVRALTRQQETSLFKGQ